MKKIETVAVLGTGVMGSQISAHLSNAGFKVFAFDMTQEIAEKGIEFSKNIKPNAFYNPKTADTITCMNYTDHLEKLSDCDWVLEAISEKIEWKHDLYRKIQSFLKDDCILTSNTSGISAEELALELSDRVRHKFFITHFFNPPRYMKLVEIIPCSYTENSAIQRLIPILEDSMGKGVVFAMDTPNFIANRIGVYGLMTTLRSAEKFKLSVEDVDGLTGTLIGHPKSATFRTADVVGLDTLSFVAGNAYDKCSDDPEKDIFKLPDFLKTMLQNKWLGQKSGQGFYKKISKGVIHSLDLKDLTYKPQEKKRFPGVRLARQYSSLKDKIHALTWSDDTAGEFTWQVFAKTLLYSAQLNGVISNDVVNIDRAMRWGFGWELGPFELWDVLGLLPSIERMKREGMIVPTWVENMLGKGYTTFYRRSETGPEFYDVASGSYKNVPAHPKNLSFNFIPNHQEMIHKNWSASIVDLGDGVAGVNIHSVLKPELNPIDGSIIQTIQTARDWVEDNGYKGLVISGDGNNFSAGANLNLIMSASIRKDWESIDDLTNKMQQVLQGLKYASFPVVAAPFGLTLGGGYEIIGACDSIVTAAELYCGLVEVGVGLIPGAGGNLRMLSNLSRKIKSPMPGAFPIVQKAFETIGFARVSSSAKEAMALGYLNKGNRIIINRDHLLWEAKHTVLQMAENYTVPDEEKFKLPGVSGRLVIESSIKGFVKAGKISNHDALIAKKLAFVLTGGQKGGPFTPVSEQYLLDIEREAFLSLCSEEKTQKRIQFMLAKGKPLRN